MSITRKPYPIERILSAATYLTAGGVGFVWLIITAFMSIFTHKVSIYFPIGLWFIYLTFELLIKEKKKISKLL